MVSTTPYRPFHQVIKHALPGIDAATLDVRRIAGTRWITVQQAEVMTQEAEHYIGQVFCQVCPIADNEYMLQLLYVREGAEPFTLNLTVVEFMPPYFAQFDVGIIEVATPFRCDYWHTHQFTICARSQEILQRLEVLDGQLLEQALQVTEWATLLLRRAIELITLPFTACMVPACRFLASDTERNKIFDARKILDENIGSPITIKDLARRVAINECYLKKGFKTLVGKTIHEYQQELRIAEAKKLLYHEQKSVTEVSALLGFSSIAHFSTAFKKSTGIKPCELLR